jgi:hypothetical protein
MKMKKDLNSLYNISLYILNHNPYGKNKPMELGLFSRILFESEAGQLFSSGIIRLHDYWEIDKKNDTIFPLSFKEMISSDQYNIWIEGDKICTDQEANLDYLSQYTKEILDNHLKVPTTANWTIETWYRVKMSSCYSGSTILLKEKKINPLMILEYVYTGLKTYVGENFEIEKSLGLYD